MVGLEGLALEGLGLEGPVLGSFGLLLPTSLTALLAFLGASCLFCLLFLVAVQGYSMAAAGLQLEPQT